MKVQQKHPCKFIYITNPKGFTLIELIVTIAVLGILLSGSVWGLIQWQRYSIYHKNYEYAQTLFLAAQSALAHREAGGNLEELSEYVNAGGDYCGLAQDYTPERTLYYMDIHLDEGEHLQSNPLYLLLKDYVYDKQIFNAAIRLEFDPDDGTVYSVSYTDRALRFDYSQSDGSDGQIMGVNPEIRENEARRKKQLMGYYDTEIAKVISQSYYRPNFKEVTLVNEETLRLHMALSSKYQAYMSRYNYRLDLYAGDKKSLSFTIDGDKLLGTDNADGRASHPVNVDVTFYDVAGQSSEPEIYPVEVCVNTKGEIDIILDAADLNAANILDAAVNTNSTLQDILEPQNYLNTTSIVRFMSGTDAASSFGIPVDTQTIYVTATASYEKYSGKPLSSNEENPLMGSVKLISGENSSCTYTLNNGRHLFNVRYLEIWHDKNPDKMQEIKYVQKKDFAWNGSEGIVAAYALYDSAQTGSSLLLPENIYPSASESSTTNRDSAPFPAIPFLGEKSSYTATGKLLQNDFAVRMLTLFEDREADLESANPDLGIAQYALGIFRVNNGYIGHIRLLDVKVDGCNYVGTVCGFNKGTLNNISVESDTSKSGNEKDSKLKRNYVNGMNYIGGIAGSDMLPIVLSSPVEPDVLVKGNYENIVNKADITGFSYVGGIVGASCLNSGAQPSARVISDCYNEGTVGVSDSVRKKDICENLGGIVGYLYGGTVENCYSSLGDSGFMDLEVPDTLDEESLRGDFMGGIAGRCTANASIVSCSADGGILFGHNYIGGIVGLWESSDISLDGQGASNSATIIGYQYVGGIAGANTTIDTKNLPNKVQPDYKGELKNWKNTGVVIPVSGYGGGITGYNTGILSNCTSTMDTYSVKGEEVLAKISVWKMPYSVCIGNVGGLVGYNDGSVLTDKKQNVVSIVTGSDFTGGLIGYNDTDARVDLDKYRLKGGYIEGASYVGGLIGCNTSVSVFKTAPEELKDYSLQASPNRVYGTSFVGGCIGGNFVIAEQDLYIQCDVSNGFGLISSVTKDEESMAGVCVGGFMGYNRLFPSGTGNEDIYSVLEHLAESVASASWGHFIPGQSDGNGTIDLPPVGEQLVPELISGKTASGNTLYILDTSGKDKYGNTLGTVTGGVMTGGIIGYNDETSFLNIQDVKNEASVHSVYFVKSDDKTCLEKKENGEYIPAEMKYNPLTDTYESANGENVNYSYTGGIIGYAANGVTINNCSFTGVLTTAEKTTYKGLLTEINEGKIIDCVSQSFGDASSEYIGGIVGRNEKDGKIYNCSSIGTLTGKIGVGGIAAENYGEISSSDKESEKSLTVLRGRLNVSTACAGGAAAFNAGTIKNLKLASSIDGKSSYVGGFVGINYGILSDIEIDTKNELSVKGSTYVGGCIGYMHNLSNVPLVIGGTKENPLLSNINVAAEGLNINGTEVGNAGGIIGYMQDGSIDVQFCIVNGKVAASLGDAGGITSNNTGKITSCTVNGDILASNGMCGGIAARNIAEAAIIGCNIGKDRSVTLAGRTCTGGISAQNAGSITSCQIGVSTDAILKNTSSSSGSLIGGITGLNEENGTIGREDGFACWVGFNNHKLQISSSASNSKLGGIAGENRGKIYGTGNSDDTRYIISDISWENDSTTGWMGGAAGYNTGTISGVSCLSNINGKNGSNGGFGGIAGENASLITNCDFSGTVKAVGSAADIVSVGGIAGKNTADGKISSCTLAKSSDTVVSTQTANKESCSYIGGAVGRNDGEIYKINCSDIADYSVAITASKGNVGGMVGYQTASGKLHDCENNKNWNIYADAYYSDSAIGGMIGYNASDEDMYNLTNWANVSRNAANNDSNSAGGIVGRLESINSNNRKISNCINWGDVKDKARVGGIIGQWKYKGGTIQNCINNGNVTQTAGSGIGGGGIIGVLFQIDNDAAVQISECINHGIVSGGSNCAGILGNSRKFTGTSTLVQIVQCVNTGTIGSGGAGIYAKQETDFKCRTELIGCRNYGYANGADNQKISGILGSASNEKLLIKDCYGVASVNPQITNIQISNQNKVNYNNYYFKSGIDGSESKPVYLGYSLSNCNFSSSNPVKNAFDYNPNTRFIGEATQNNPIKNAEDRLALTIKFLNALNQPAASDTDSMQITWFDNGTEREYYFKLYVKYENEDSFVCLEAPESKYWSPSDTSIETAERFWIGSSVKGTSSSTVTLPADSNNLDQVEIKFSDSASWNAASKITEIKLEYYSNSDAGEGKSRYISFFDVHIDGIPVAIKPIVHTDNGWDAALYIKENGSKYSADIIKDTETPYIKELDANPLDESSYKYSSKILYDLIDKQLKQGTAERKPLSQKPENLTFNSDSAGYKLHWDSVEGAFSYNVTVKLYDSPDSSVPIENEEYFVSVPVGTEVDIPVKSSWGNLYMKAFVKAVHVLTDAENNYDSQEAESSAIKVIPPLPAPQAHLERLCENDKSYIILCIDNIEHFYDANGNLYPCSFAVSINNGQKGLIKLTEENFNLETGEGTPLQKLAEITSKDNISLQFQAIPDKGAGYLNSVIVTVQTSLPSASDLKGDAISKIQVSDTDEAPPYYYTGSSPENIGFTTWLKTNKMTAYYYKSDLLIFDKELGVDVSVSSTETFLSTYAGNVSASVGNISSNVIDDLVDTLADNGSPVITARTYLWATQEHSQYFGKRMPINGSSPLTSNELFEKYGEFLIEDGVYTITDENGSQISKKKYKTKSGYTVERISGESDTNDPLYNIYYSTVLDKYSNQKTETSVKITDRQNPAPVMSTNYTNINGKYHFAWDLLKSEGGTLDESPTNALYDVTITGITADGNRVELLSTHGQKDNFAEIDQKGLNYVNVEVKVIRQSSMITSEKNFEIIDKFFNCSRYTYRTYLPLPQITMPVLKLHGNNQDELKYDISWKAINDLTARADLKEYQIFALVHLKSEDGTEITKESLEHCFGQGNVTAYNDSDGNFSSWKILLGTKPLIPPEDYEGEYKENILEACDLESLQGCKVRFFVNAIAVPHEDEGGNILDNVIYTDSEEGVMSNEILLPKRLTLPSDIKFQLSYGDGKGDEVRTEEEFMKLAINCLVTSDSASGDGAYKFEAAVYPDKQDDLTIIEKNDDGSYKVSEDACENGSIKVQPLVPERGIFVKTPGGSLNATTLAIKTEDLTGWSSELAGKYLVVRCRVADDSNISSAWSEYQVYRLPASMLPALVIKEQANSFTVGEHEGRESVLNWISSNSAYCYEIELHALNGDNISTQQVVLSVTFDDGGVPQVVCDGTTLNPQTNESTYTFKLSDIFAYTAKWPWSSDSQKRTGALNVTQKAEDNGNYSYEFALTLPDIDSIEYNEVKYQYLYTSMVQITAKANPESSYQDSDSGVWIRVSENNDSQKLIKSIFQWNRQDDINQTIQNQEGNSQLSKYTTSVDTLPEILKTSIGNVGIDDENALSKKKGQISGNSISGNNIHKPDSSEETSSSEESTETPEESTSDESPESSTENIGTSEESMESTESLSGPETSSINTETYEDEQPSVPSANETVPEE